MRLGNFTAAAVFAIIALAAAPETGWAAPSITSFTPARAAAGSAVSITGSGFIGAQKVKFGSVAARFTVVSDQSIRVTVPPLAGTAKITVVSSSGSATSPNPFATPSGTPVVALSLPAGPPTSAPSISGSGFAAYEVVDIYEGVTDVALAATNASGIFAGIPLTVPSTALPGYLWVTAVGRHSQLAAQKPFLVRTDWPNRRRNVENSGWNPFENVLDSSSVSRLELAWTTTGGNYYGNVPPGVAYDGYLFAAVAHFGKLVALRTDGTQAWSQAFSSSFFSGPTPAAGSGVLVAASSDGKVHAYNWSTGAPKWTSRGPSDTGAGSPVVINGIAVVPGGTQLQAFNLTTGARLWGYAGLCANTFSTPAISAGTIVFSCRDSGGNPLLVSVSMAGTFIGSALAAGTGTTSAPAIDGSNVYSLFGGVLEARSISGFYPRFSLTPPFSVFADPAAGDGIVVTCGNGIWAVNAVDGSTRFSNVNYPCNAPVTIANGVIYEPQGGDIAMFTEYGSPLGRLGTGGAAGPVTIADGSVYAAESITGVDRWAIPKNPGVIDRAATRPNPRQLHPNRKLKPYTRK